ncbi:hypothetical protein [Bradyrhizobium cosmicum]|uniref:hypothetical protein n=1 Tax=Bradyrhizobium cosmicum TaxID=1404864 RepID=UPI0011624BE3|nr:hypothetical protein [Bradyrhizobium cosmicum]QDP20642.1 hypothetical protein FNV92_00075 [Bradyrhizobium cosmicum]QDP20693.1 hypothetical protein FNV92_00350 [Bradyrhizobium cosmicum]
MIAARAILFGLDRRVIVGAVRVVVAEGDAPKIIMFDGEPFLQMPVPPAWDAKAVLAYGQERPYRADDGLLEVAS